MDTTGGGVAGRRRGGWVRMILVVVTGLAIGAGFAGCGGSGGSARSSTPTDGAPTAVTRPEGSAPAVGPFLPDPNNPEKADTHWHAALGVYDCDHWMGDTTGSGIWNWPTATPQGAPGRADEPNEYAGLHSHDDGIIHMEPAVAEETGANATLGLYFAFGGWRLSATSFSFLGTSARVGQSCAGTPATMQWEVAKWNGTTGPQTFTVERGDPAAYKLFNYDIVVIALLPRGVSLASIGSPPSLANLAKELLPPPTSVPAGA